VAPIHTLQDRRVLLLLQACKDDLGVESRYTSVCVARKLVLAIRTFGGLVAGDDLGITPIHTLQNCRVLLLLVPCKDYLRVRGANKSLDNRDSILAMSDCMRLL
jgi:hypothetical protein